MSTSSTILANRQNFYFTLWANQTPIPAQKSAALDPFAEVLHFFAQSEIVNIVEHDVRPAGNLYHKDSLLVTFSLSDTYSTRFSLLRGLFGFGKWSGLSTLSDTANKTFQIAISSTHSENALDYFKNIFSELTREIKFKRALKDLLVVQNEANRIQAESLANLAKSIL